MSQFYEEYWERPILQPLVAEISWAKNMVIMTRCKDDLQREFYLRATARFGWTKAVLQHQIDNQSCEKYLLNQTNFDQTLTPLFHSSLKPTVTDSPAPNRLQSDCVSGIKNARPLMSDSLIPTPSSAFYAHPRETLLYREIAALDAESAEVLETIKGLL